MKTSLVISLKIIFVLTILTGFIYPLMITGIGQFLFHRQANGNLVMKDNIIVGSELIGQHFDSAIYFWPRPSAIDYQPLPSSGSNFGPTSAKLKTQKNERLKAIIESNGLSVNADIPGDLLFASSSGLDPHISRNAALLQVNRVVAARKFNDEQKKEVTDMINRLMEEPQYGVLGDERINVLDLNLELDKIK
jgi:potassium-transporting ATPase KdpC subunit